MAELVARARRRAQRRMVGLAAIAGSVGQSLPSAAGAAAISWGLGEIYRPLLLIGLGLFALAADWKRTTAAGER